MFSFDRLTPAQSLREPQPLATGFSELDALLLGGFGTGQVVELSGAASSGKATLAFSACLRALDAGRACAWIGSPERFCPLAALESGADLERLLVVHAEGGLAQLRAAQTILACPGAVAVLVVDAPPGFRPKSAQLVKLQRLAERSGTALVFVSERVGEEPSLGSIVSLRLHLSRPRFGALRARVLRHKGGATGQSVEEPVHGPDRLRVRSSL